MQREIKFRVWNKTYHEMFYVSDHKNGEYDEKIYLTLEGKLRGNFKNCGDVDCSDDYAIQQYTGLKDKNGKEIYEGDIIEYPNGNYENQTVIMEVVHPFTYSNANIVEVIGNIFQVPERLKQ